MNAIQLNQPGELVRIQIPEPGMPGPGEALVAVHSLGICGTDIHAFHGRQPFFSYPRILGHELGVEVLEVGREVGNVAPGDRCAVEPYLNCGMCPSCRRGRGNCCVAMRVLGVHVDGGMRGRMLVPATKLHPGAGLGYDALALVEPLAIGSHAVERAAVAAGDNVLVIGAGPIGLAVMTFARLAGGRVIAMDVDATRLAYCRDVHGVDGTVMAGAVDIEPAVRARCGGDLPHVVFDATGNPSSMAAAFAYTAHAGRLIFVGLFQGDVTFHDPSFHSKELTLLASRNALGRDFTTIIAAMESGDIDVMPWITHRALLMELPEIFDSWTGRESLVVKAVVEINS